MLAAVAPEKPRTKVIRTSEREKSANRYIRSYQESYLLEQDMVKQATGKIHKSQRRGGYFPFTSEMPANIMFSLMSIHCPALALSPKLCNTKTGLLMCVPLTSQVKGFPFEVELQHRTIQGVALADQVKSLDWTVRHAQKKGKASNDVVNKVRAKIKLLLKLT